MRYLAYVLLLVVVLVPLALAGAAFLALSDTPLISRAAELTPAHIERAKRIVEKNDPRKMKAGVLRTLTLSQEDIDLAANYLAHRYGNGSSRIALQPGVAAVTASIELPRNPAGRYLNVTAVLHETPGLPEFDQLQVGQLAVPSRLAGLLLEHALARLSAREDYRLVSDTVKTVSVADGQLTIVYDWQENLPDRIRAVALPRDDQERLKIYQEQLVRSAGQSGSVTVPLSDLMRPLFQLAQQRSVTSDPAAENRAAIVVLAFHVNGKGLAAIVPAARDWPRAPPRRIALAGRGDFAQHFTLSAALAASAGAPLADAIGLYKEVDDSRAGSGFSFNDIAADRAGTRFGELATGSRASAMKLQRQVSEGARDGDLIPPVKDLPEFMPEAEFKRRFGGIGAPPYKRMMDDIERRIAALQMYR